MSQAIILLGQPGGGKSTVGALLPGIIKEKTGAELVNLDNERIWTVEKRNEEARTAPDSRNIGFSSADDPAFRQQHGFRILTNIAETNAEYLAGFSPNAVGVIHLPDKNPAQTFKVDGKDVPVLEKTKLDYAALGITISGIVVLTFEGDDKEFVQAFEERFKGRGENNPEQVKLDADKYGEADLLKRRGFCEAAAKIYPSVRLPLNATREQAAEMVANTIINNGLLLNAQSLQRDSTTYSS